MNSNSCRKILLLLATCSIAYASRYRSRGTLIGKLGGRGSANSTTTSSIRWIHTAKGKLAQVTFCNKNQAADQHRELAATWDNSVPSNSCLSYLPWLPALQRTTLPESMMVVEVGSAYGYTGLTLVTALKEASSLTAQALTQRHTQLQAEPSCDTCGGCEGAVGRAGESTTPVLQLHTFERDAKLAKLVSRVVTESQDSAQLKGLNWKVHEGILQGPVGGSKGAMVPSASTLDHFADANLRSGESIDLLLVHRSENIMQVLDGSQSLLNSQRVQLIVFDYDLSRDKLWDDRTLHTFVLQMYKRAYICYLVHYTGVMARLTACWTPKLKKVPFGTVVCTVDSSPVYPLLEASALTANLSLVTVARRAIEEVKP